MPPLADRIISALRKRFAKYGHYPSDAHWEGLRAIAYEIERQAEGIAPRDFAYSALPCGMGKTSVVVEAVQLLTTDPAYRDKGIVIFTNTLEQIPVLIQEMGLQSPQFVVQTGVTNVELNTMGRGEWREITRGPRRGERVWEPDVAGAQVLFTTQQKLLQVARYRHDFEDIWRYRPKPEADPKPRQVRIWDEAIMPAEPLTITADEVRAFADCLATGGELQAADQLRAWAAGLDRDGLSTGTSMVPEWWGLMRRDGLDLIEDESLGGVLFSLAGRQVRVLPADGYNTATTISYREILPDNFAPLLILDASGSLRVTYQAWKRGRGGLRELPSEEKTYRNLKIFHWDHPAGKAAYRAKRNQERLAGAVLEALKKVPRGEKLLVIHRLHEKPYADFVKLVTAKVRGAGENPDRLRFVHWGKHRATNEFADIRHVIAVGLLQYGPAANEAIWRAAGKVPASTKVPREKLEATRLGEVADHLFQGVSRGAVRKSVDGDVPEGCVLWAIFCTSGNMAIPRDRLERVFPGASVEDWTPYGTELINPRRKSKRRPAFLQTLLAHLGDKNEFSFEIWDLVPKGDLAERQRVQTYLDDPAIKSALAECGVQLERHFVPRRRTSVGIYRLRRDVAGPGEWQRKMAVTERATDWLKEQLSEGPLPVSELRRRAEAFGLDPRTVRGVREAAGIISEPSPASGRERIWRLANPPQ